jgi:very-short-patch-repair endonuclease
VFLEVDGVRHMAAGQWYHDLLRQAEVSRPGRDWVVRIPASALRLEPERVVRILQLAFLALAA